METFLIVFGVTLFISLFAICALFTEVNALRASISELGAAFDRALQREIDKTSRELERCREELEGSR